MDSKENPIDNNSQNPDTDNRYQIAKLILPTSLYGIFILAGFLLLFILTHGSYDPVKEAKEVLTTLLPVVGTWIGTILAFYFAKENFESAHKNMRDLVKQITPNEKLSSIKVTDKMIPEYKIEAYKLSSPNAEEETTNLLEAMQPLKKPGITRLPILDETGAIKYVIHKSLFDKYLANLVVDGEKDKEHIKTLVFKDFLNDKDAKPVIMGSCGYVSENSSLADAKNIMDKKGKACEDVIITQNGQPNERAIGWITDIIISENAKV